MSICRLFAIAGLVLGAFCPAGTHALAHAVKSSHLHSHENGTVHAHEHDADGHHEPELRHADDAPRLAASSFKLVPGVGIEAPVLCAAAPDPIFASCLIRRGALDPPPISAPTLLAPPSAGRAPPA